MKVKSIILVGLLFLVVHVSAQITDVEKNLTTQVSTSEIPDGWRLGGVTTLNFSQLALVNWAAGGQNSVSLNGLVSVFASYKKNLLNWNNTLDLGYGFLNQKDDPIKEFRKTDDKIDFSSMVGYKAFSDFYYSGLLNFRTQFSQGYDYKVDEGVEPPVISNFFSPAYFTLAAGLSYQPNKYFTAFLAPATARVTIVEDRDLRELYSVDIDKATRWEFGGYLRTIFTKNDFQPEFLRNVTFTSKLDLFSNYLDKPQNVDVNWELLVALKVNKFLSVNVNTNLIYDDDIKIADKNGRTSPKVQFKELLGVGFSYNF